MNRLYIYDQEVELDNNVQFAITKQFEDISNPTVIINNWSKSIDIPFTQKNSKLFGSLFNPDKIIASVNYKPVGAPTRILFWSAWTGRYEEESYNGFLRTSDPISYVQVSLQNEAWEYDQSSIETFKTSGEFIYRFKLTDINNKLEFSFRGNNDFEYYFAQYYFNDLVNALGLKYNSEYNLKFNLRFGDTTYGSTPSTVIDNVEIQEIYTTDIYFNPYEKLDFRLDWNDSVLMQGYCKLNEIKQINGKGYYNITLFGELGKIFSEMQKIGFFGDDDKYVIDGSKYINEKINRLLLKNVWENGFDLSEGSIEVNSEDYSINRILNFLPKNSFSPSFDYKSYQPTYYTTNTFEKALENIEFEKFTGVAPSSVIKEGLLPREIGEYRSWLQVPVIRFRYLFEIFMKKVKEITKYDYVLDNKWFNSTNPFWNKLLYTLDITKKPDYYYYDYQYEFGRDTSNTLWSDNYTDTRIMRFDNNKFKFSGDSRVEVILNLDIFRTINTSFKIANDNYLTVTVRLEGNGKYKEFYYNIFNEDADIPASALPAIPAGTSVNIDNQRDTLSFNLIFPFDVDESFGNELTFSVAAHWNRNSYPFTNRINTDNVFIRVESCNINVLNSNKWVGSDMIITLNNLWNNDFNLFNEIIKYIKYFRIFVNVDDVNKKIVFTKDINYFNEYEIEDWTDKLDKSKDYIIKPIITDSKYLLFDTKNDCELNNIYNEEYGVNYGSYKLETNNKFNDNTEDLITISTVISHSPAFILWENLYNNKQVVYSGLNEKYINFSDKDNKYVSNFGAYGFYSGLSEFVKTKRTLGVSDDTVFQINNDLMLYTQSVNTVEVDKYCGCSEFLPYKNAILSVLPVKPKKIFSKEDYIFDIKGVYNLFWEKYLNERYDTQNKIVTCYIRLTPQDYINFEFNKFIMIENQLYMVNKIYDYNIDSNEPTKVDLITVQDITGYTTNNFNL